MTDIEQNKPDPLVEVLDALKDGRAGPTTESYAHHIRAALDDLGFEIREKAVEDYTNAIRSEERAKVVALLREMAISFPEGREHRLSAIAITCAADGIERGDHLGKSK